jgi:hypothetical protein
MESTSTLKTNPDAPNSSPRQTDILFLIACAAIIIGFFLNWFSVIDSHEYINPDATNPMGMLRTVANEFTINGIRLTSKLLEVGGLALILCFLVVSIPIGSIIIMFNRYAKKRNLNIEILCTSLVTLIPALVLFVYLFEADQFNFSFINLGDIFKNGLGIGIIITIISSMFFIINVISGVIKETVNSKKNNYFIQGIVGGLIFSGASALLIKAFFSESLQGVKPSYLLVIIVVLLVVAVLIANKIYSGKAKFVYHEVLGIGFITALSGGILLYYFLKLIYGGYMQLIPTSFVTVFVFFLVQFGFVISSVINALENADTPVFIKQSIETETPALITVAEPHSVQENNIVVLPKTPPFDLKAFVEKNKLKLLILAALLIIGGCAWWFFKPNPQKDGLNAAKLQCDCNEKNNDVLTKIYKDFISSFDNQKFKSRAEARNSIQQALNAAGVTYTDCSTKAQQKVNEFQSKYKDESLNIFNTAFQSQQQLCNPPNTTTENSVYVQAENKIASIVDPEPNINSIKTSLIGNVIPGWKFDFITEFKEMAIITKEKSNDRIEYQLSLKLQGNGEPTEHEAQVMAVYSLNNSGWSMTEVKEIYITFDYTIPNNDFVQVSPISGCSWNASNQYKLIWKAGFYDNELMSGPDVGQLTLPPSSTYYLKSREQQPVIVRFTYKPVN